MYKQYYVIGRRYSSSKNEEDVLKNVVEDPDGSGYSCGLCGKGFGMEKGHGSHLSY